MMPGVCLQFVIVALEMEIFKTFVVVIWQLNMSYKRTRLLALMLLGKKTIIMSDWVGP